MSEVFGMISRNAHCWSLQKVGAVEEFIKDVSVKIYLIQQKNAFLGRKRPGMAKHSKPPEL